MRKNITIDDIDFEDLIKKVQDLSRNTTGTPDVYCLIQESLFGPCFDGCPNDEYEFAGKCLHVMIKLGYGVG